MTPSTRRVGGIFFIYFHFAFQLETLKRALSNLVPFCVHL